MPRARFYNEQTGEAEYLEVPEGTTPEQAQALYDQQSGTQVPPQPPREEVPLTFPQKVQGTVGTVARMGVGMVAEPIAGVAGLATGLASGTDAGAERVKQIQQGAQNLLGEPSVATQRVGQAVGEMIPNVSGWLGDNVYELTGSAELATLAATFPAAVEARLGLKAPSLLQKMRGGERLTPEETRSVEAELDAINEANTLAGGTPDDPASYQDVMDSLAQLPESRPLSEVLTPNEATIRAAESEGLGDSLPPSMATQGPAQGVLRGLEDAPVGEGKLDIPKRSAQLDREAFEAQLMARAKAVIEEGQGYPEKSAFNTEYNKRLDDELDGMSNAISTRYRDEIDPAMNAAFDGVTVDLPALRAMVDQQLKDKYTSISTMPPPLRIIARKLYHEKKTSVKRKKPILRDGEPTGRFKEVTEHRTKLVKREPSYTEFNNWRRDVGDGIRKKNNTPYAGVSGEILSPLYARAKQDQRAKAEEAGVADALEAADALGVRKAAMEENRRTLQGKEIKKSIIEVSESLLKTASAKGNVDTFTKVLNQIPESQRRATLMTGIGELIKEPKQFSAFMGALAEMPSMKQAVFSHLPTHTQKSLNNFAEMYKAMETAKGAKLKESDLAKLAMHQETIAGKLITKSMSSAKALAYMRGGPLHGTTASVAEKAADLTREAYLNKTNRAQFANDLMATPEFRRLQRNMFEGDIPKPDRRGGIRKGASKGAAFVNRQTEKALMKTRQFKRWYNDQPEAVRAKVDNIGFVAFLQQSPEEVTAPEEEKRYGF